MGVTRKPLGPAAAALVGSGIGVFVIGLATTLNEALGLGPVLNWWSPAGPLTGKTTLGVIAWLVSWAILHRIYRDRDVEVAPAALWTWILVGVGFLLTFPPFYELFGH